MSFTSFLSAVGKDFKAVFAWLGSPQGQAAVTGAESVATTVVALTDPAAALPLAGVEALINAGLKSVISIESVAAAAGTQSGTGAQKLAAVVAAVAPQVGSFLTSIGVSNPTAAQEQQLATEIANGLVAILNAFPAPSSTSPAA